MLPVRCFSCGKVVADVYEKYCRYKKDDRNELEIWKLLKITRYCCRRMIISHVDYNESILRVEDKIQQVEF